MNELKELEAELALAKELYEAWCRAETRALVEAEVGTEGWSEDWSNVWCDEWVKACAEELAVTCVENQDELLDDIRILEAVIKEILNES